MKKLSVLLMFALSALMLMPGCSTTSKMEKNLKRDVKEKMKEYKREGWKIYGSSTTLEKALYEHYQKLQSPDYEEIMGEATNFKSKGIGSQTTFTNATLKYARIASQSLRARIVGEFNNDNDDLAAEFDKIYTSYEIKVQKEIKGELRPSYSIIRLKQKSKDGNEVYEMQTFFLINETAASRARLRALDDALKESEAAQEYARKISEFVQEGFKVEE